MLQRAVALYERVSAMQTLLFVNTAHTQSFVDLFMLLSVTLERCYRLERMCEAFCCSSSREAWSTSSGAHAACNTQRTE